MFILFANFLKILPEIEFLHENRFKSKNEFLYWESNNWILEVFSVNFKNISPNVEDMQVFQIVRRSQDLGLQNRPKMNKIGGGCESYECLEPYDSSKDLDLKFKAIVK